MASRILGMGDVLTLIEKAEAAFDQKKAAELEQKLRSSKFTLQDFYDQLVPVSYTHLPCRRPRRTGPP